MSDQISVRVAPNGHAAYVSHEADALGQHHGTMKHSDRPVSVLWNPTVREWEETPHSAARADDWVMDLVTERWMFRER